MKKRLTCRIAEVFARGHTLNDVASEWLKSFEESESQAVADLVNFVLKSAGCDLKVTDHDIEDPDNCTDKLEDIQGEFQAVSYLAFTHSFYLHILRLMKHQHDISDYPIIAKGKATLSFKDSVTGFYHALIKAIYNSGLLFDSIALIENIQIWLSAMSAAQNRPFRHTATVVSLSIITSLCEVGAELAEISATALRHSETQRKQKKINKSRVSDLQQEAKQAKANQETLDTLIRDWFDTIYIHRYRDVDPHIRVDCAKAMGDWIMTYPEIFFDGSHLRYLGWILSDPNHATRLEVVKQMQRFYRDKNRLSGLKTFTERFRSRMVEMATRDAEPSVRAAAVELLDLLREGGLLEPDDIDAVGRLIFDAEPRVRKAVVGFFAESIADAFEAKIEDLGGQESVEEALGDADDSPDHPSLKWLKFKCLAQGLEAYDSIDGDLPPNIQRGPGQDNFLLHAASVESHFMVAAETLFDQIDEVREWEAIAGYLLYDSSGEASGGAAGDAGTQLRQELRLGEKEEVILLEVLNASVKQAVAKLVDSNLDKKTKKTKKQREEISDLQEQTARQLTNLIPRLLKKFGESPQTATTVLRLERVVSLDAFHEFRQDSSTYADLLDDINKQFMTHGNEELLAEAGRALLRAKGYHELNDTTDEKIEGLWDDTVNTFLTIVRGKKVEVRGSMSNTVLDGLVKTVLRLERLASISKPIEFLETMPTRSSAKFSDSTQLSCPIDTLISLVQRAETISGKRESPETAVLEDSLAIHASRTVMFYFMWRVPALIASLKSSAGIDDDELDTLAGRRDSYVNALTQVLKNRHATDELVCSIAGQLLDAYLIMGTLRRVPVDENIGDDFLALALDVDADTQKRIFRIFGAAEATYAKLTHKHLEAPKDNDAVENGVDADTMDPIDRDPEDEDDDAGPPEHEEEDEAETDTQANQVRRSQKLQRSLVAEQKLCELAAKLVLAVLGGLINGGPARTRLLRNKTKLGPNFREVLGHLDVNEPGKKTKKGRAATAKANAAKKSAVNAKSKETVDEEEDEDDDEEQARTREIQEDEDVDMVENDEQDEALEDVEAPPESVLGD